MDAKKPTRRKDLIIEKGEVGGKTAYTIKDPVSQQFFRVGELENLLLTLMDGTRDYAGIAAELKERAGIDATAEEVEEAVSQFETLRLIESDLTGKELERAQRKEIRKGKSLLSKILYVKFKAVNPEKLFEKLLPRTRFLFARPALLAYALVIAGGLVVAVPNWGEIARGLPRLWSLGSVALIWLTMAVVVALHEMAHGLTCHYFGGRVKDMGFLLLYFQLAFYCNVSDAWLFKEKYKRAWVTLAGGFFQLFVWSLAVIGWRVTAEDVLINRIFFIIMVTAGVQFIFNFNPLIKLDGYYLLSDLVEIPNLRAKAFDYIKSLLTFREGSSEYSGREKRIFLIYGVCSVLFTTLLLGWIFVKLSHFLIEKYGTGGFIIVAALVGVIFSKPAAGSMKKIVKYILTGEGLSGKLYRFLRLVVIVAVVLLFLAFFRWELRISADCRFLPGEAVTVRNRVEGIVETVYVREGSRVEQGTLLFSIAKRDAQVNLDEAVGDLKKAEAELRLLLKGVRPEEIERAEKKRETAKTKLNYAEVEYRRLRKLHRSKLLSSQELKEAEEERAVRSKELDEAESELKILMAGCQQEEVESIRAEIQKLKQKAAYLEKEIELSDVRSPIKGVVTTPHPERRVGEFLEKGTEFLRLADLDTMEVEIYVSEKEIGEIEEGQKVKMKAWGYPTRSFHGEVKYVSEAAMPGNSPNLIVVRSSIENGSRILKPETTGNAKIYCGKRSLLTLITRRLIRFIRVEFWF